MRHSVSKTKQSTNNKKVDCTQAWHSRLSSGLHRDAHICAHTYPSTQEPTHTEVAESGIRVINSSTTLSLLALPGEEI